MSAARGRGCEVRAMDALKEWISLYCGTNPFRSVEVPDGGLQQDYDRMMSTLTAECGNESFAVYTIVVDENGRFAGLQACTDGEDSTCGETLTCMSNALNGLEFPAWPERDFLFCAYYLTPGVSAYLCIGLLENDLKMTPALPHGFDPFEGYGVSVWCCVGVVYGVVEVWRCRKKYPPTDKERLSQTAVPLS